MKDVLTVAVVSTGILSIFVCIILGYANRYEGTSGTRRTSTYSVMLYTLVVALVAECLSWGLDGIPGTEWVVYIANFISTVLSLVLLGQFTLYIGMYVEEKTGAIDSFTRSAIKLNAALILFTIIVLLTGKVYVMRDGYYVEDILYPAYFVTNVIAMVTNILSVAVNWKSLGKHDGLASCMYMAIPLVTSVVGTLLVGCSFAYQASTLSLVVLYAFIQSEYSRRLETEKSISEYYAYYDEMTGLKNRRAYTDRVEQLSGSEVNMGLIFADINGLKYQNDHFGHVAGDKLITDFAGLLKEHFPTEEIYRISGDEFIVFSVSVSREQFEARADAAGKAMKDGSTEIACMGTEYGSSRKVEDLVRMAEAVMYENKEAYHRKHPELNR